jgi:iron uptake system component EfeO
MRTTPVHALLGAALLVGVAGCGGTDTGSTAKGSGAIAVEATDTECSVQRTEAAAGTIEFTVRNTGSKVNEFYLLGEGDQVLGEVENITPGLTRTFHVQVAEPGTYTTACKPGMRGSGIRGEFTVTGTTAAAKNADQKLTEAVERYEGYVAAQSDELLARTTEFVALVKAGKVEQAKALYPVARGPWERIEPVAESFGDLDPMIDGRADVVQEGLAFTGFHRLEKDLWVDGLQQDSPQIADKLLADVRQVVTRAKAVELNPLQLANGSKSLLDEVATGKITGEEDRYSHTDLYDFDENYRGCKDAIDALRPALQERDPELLTALDARFKALDAELDEHRTDGGFRLYTELSADEVKDLTVKLDAVSEQVAQVAGVVAA